MLKLFLRWAHWLTDAEDIDLVETDLLQHPALERMSERELADLPIERGNGPTRCIA